MSTDNHGHIMEGDPSTGHAFFVGLHGRSWIVVGDYAGEFMTDRSRRYSDDLHGPHATREAAQAQADRFNAEERR